MNATNKKMPTAVMIRSALLGVIGAVLMQLSISLPIFPGFLSLDINALPAVIGAVTTGPLAGVLVALVTNLVDPIIFGTSTGGIGNFANFSMSAALVLPIGMIYRRHRNLTGYVMGSVVGVVATVITAVILNYFVLLPLYSQIFIPMETIIAIANAINSSVHDVPTLILFTIVPFNLLKATMTVVLGYVTYRALRPLLNRMAAPR